MAEERRLHLPAMDALRAGAALLVVSTHAAAAYMDVQQPALLWVIHDRAASRVFDWVFWWCNGVSMPLFFVLAGFFAAQVCDERGPAVFVRLRSKRLLVPFVVGCIVILPVTFYVWAGGWLLQGRCTLKEILRVHFGPSIQPDLWGPAHLWFLEYLFLLCLAFAAVEMLRAGRALGGVAAPPLLVVATALVLWVDPSAPIHFHNSFVPDPARLLYYAVFFAAGIWLRRSGERVMESRRLSVPCVVVSLVAFCGVALLLRRHLDTELSGLSRLFLVTAMLVFVWGSVLGFVGLAQRVCTRESVAVSYLAAASYWTYLVHVPVVGLAQVSLFPLPAPALVKCAIVFVLALGVSLLSYERVVRRTFIGRWLSGTPRVVAHAGSPRRASASAVAHAG